MSRGNMNKSYMGRVFLPPASLPQELHVNIGHFVQGLQAYHE